MRVASSEGERELSISIGLTRVDPGEGNASVQLRNAIVALKRAKSEGRRPGRPLQHRDRRGDARTDPPAATIARRVCGRQALPDVPTPDHHPGSKAVQLRSPAALEKRRRAIHPARPIHPVGRAGRFDRPDRPLGVSDVASCAQAHSCQRISEMRMAINVSACSFGGRTSWPSWKPRSRNRGRPAHGRVGNHRIHLGDRHQGYLKLLQAIREMGFSIAVDDFGTGYSSLSSIDRWPVNRLKIDRSFIRTWSARKRGHAWSTWSSRSVIACPWRSWPKASRPSRSWSDWARSAAKRRRAS